MIIYLNVPFAEKDECLALGGKWDGKRKLWYVPAKKSPASFERWMTPEGAASWRQIYGSTGVERGIVRRAVLAIDEGRS